MPATANVISLAQRVRQMGDPAGPPIDIGHASAAGPRPRNEDFVGAVTPEGAELLHKGVLAAVADGLGGHNQGREAAEQIVRGLLSDYYATPETWAVAQSLDKVLSALNRWLHARAQRSPETAGMATTLSALVLRGNRYYSAHIGDSRIYRLRAGRLERLTNDHTWEHPELSGVLSRAIGLDQHVAVDYADGELEQGDVFAVLTDGVWARLRDARLAAMLGAGTTADALAAELTAAALASGAQDNCTALVVRVNALPAANLRDSLEASRQLPLPPRLRVGDTIDGLQVESVVHESRSTLLYRVRAAATGERLVLKTLRPGSDPDAAAALVHEEWLARRVTAHYFPQVVTHEARAHLYYLMSWHDGATLGARLAQGHRYTPAEIAQIGIRLLKGIGALHRLAIVHRDIKPENLHLGTDARLRILDLGVAASDGHDLAEINNPGTPSYMAPELFAGEKASEAADLYACGVTLYRLLTRKFPYGEIEPFQRPRFGEAVAVTRYRPDVPGWLEAVLARACARDPAQRFETAEEFRLALERGASAPLALARKRPLAQRNPLLLLAVLLAASVILNLGLLLLLTRPT
jgi:serine/threonine protein phosphatase PrpC